MWYKKEKCCFGFLYHDRLSLSSTLCGEEPVKAKNVIFLKLNKIAFGVVFVLYIHRFFLAKWGDNHYYVRFYWLYS
ncbi:hypothetical protein BRO54_0504 [Geobacillus proteiniphilus]|uniref:Uncharacterized protein n=1 Tax=Geobacillus proteiniphilus TaxID=860353 RepID=A0A1Q5T821_9BACL|nr:hypothetical protein BRO54_0504 [Geobacillus proteiniphilus]